MICDGIRLELASHDLACERDGEREQFVLDLPIEVGERSRKIVQHAVELLHFEAQLLLARGNALAAGRRRTLPR